LHEGGFPIAFGNYLLERRLAVGGTSEVYLARPRVGTHPAPRVVIKRLLPAFLEDPTFVGMFATEARLHRSIRHPNVVQVFEAGVVRNEPYLAMEYIDGVDAFRLLRRLHQERRPVPFGVSIFIARSICDALSAVHVSTDLSGQTMKMVHRDVTPSNIYLSVQGDIRLGDFGIARELGAARSSHATTSAVIKGKYNYLSPEQVNGEPFDHRADLFSLAVVTTEMILGEPLFRGNGQLAILLAIRDCRIDALREIAGRLPDGLFDVLERALKKEAAARYQTAKDFAEALAPFVPSSRESVKQQLKNCVIWAQQNATGISQPSQPAVDDLRLRKALSSYPTKVASMRPPASTLPSATDFDDERDEDRNTLEIDLRPSRIRYVDGRLVGPLSFARVIEMLVTGELAPHDEVDLLSEGFRRVIDIELLLRHLPDAETTRSLRAPNVNEVRVELRPESLLPLIGRIARFQETGLLLFDLQEEDSSRQTRREVYVQQGVVVHIASTDASELLGRSLVRRGKLSPEELDMALAVLSRFDGRLGDTLIALGLIDPVDLFHSIRDQGRERFTKVFSYQSGTVTFRPGIQPTRVEFPLNMELSQVLLEGVSVAFPDGHLLRRYANAAGSFLYLVPPPSGLPPFSTTFLPPSLTGVIGIVGEGPLPVHLLLQRVGALPNRFTKLDTLRAVETGLALNLLAWDGAPPAGFSPPVSL